MLAHGLHHPTPILISQPHGQQRQARDALRAQLIELDAEELRVLAVLNGVRTARLEASRALERALPDVPYIDVLSPELLGLIFVHCLPGDRERERLPRPHVSEAPLLLARVCRRWRAVVLSHSRLWEGVRVDLDGHASPGLCDALEQWLLRSGTRPLSVSIRCQHFYHVIMANIPKALSKIEPYRARWRSIDLSVFSCHARAFMENIGETPLLEELCIRVLPLDTHQYFTADLPLAPNLTRIRFSGWNGLLNLNCAALCNLTNLHLEDHPYGNGDELAASQDYYVDLLSRCPVLERCTISVGSPLRHEPHGTARVPLPKLRSLALKTLEGARVGFLLDRLVLPALRMLKLEDAHPRHAVVDAWPHLTALLARSRAPLEDLCLARTRETSGLAIPETDIIAALRHVPRLRVLRLKYTTLTDTFLHALARGPPAAHQLCPRLHRLEVSRAKFSNDAVLDMLLARWQVDEDNDLVRLPTRVKLYLCGLRKQLERDMRIQGLIDRGLDLSVEKPHSWGDGDNA